MTKSSDLTIALVAIVVGLTCSPSCSSETPPPPPSVYHFRPTDYPVGVTSRNLECEGSEGGLQCRSLADGHVAMTTSLDGRVTRFFVDAPGSKNIHVTPGKGKGTTIAGLTFQTACVINVWASGVVELDKEGVSAKDESGHDYVSRRADVEGKKALVMVEAGAEPRAAGKAPPGNRTPPVVTQFDLTSRESSVRAAAAAALKQLPSGTVNAMSAPVVGRLPALTISLSGAQPVSVRIVSGFLVAMDAGRIKVWIGDPRPPGTPTYLTLALDANTRYCDAAAKRTTGAAFQPGELVTVWAADGSLPQQEEATRGTLTFLPGSMSTTVSSPYMHVWAEDAAFPPFESPPSLVRSLRRGPLKANIIDRKFEALTCYELALPF